MDDRTPPEPFSPDTLDVSGLPATTDDLRGVLGRHRRRQARLLGAGLVGVLAAGVVAGFAVGRDGVKTTSLQAAPASPTAAPDKAASMAASGGVSSIAVAGSKGGPPTQVLVRNATDGTRVRLYQRDMTATVTCQPAGTPCPPPPSCAPKAILSAEVSDDQVAGTADAPQWDGQATDGLQALTAQVVGSGEPQPILTVIAHVPATVTKVTMTTAGGSDTATPTAGGWVALAEQLPAGTTDAPAGTVTATTASGAPAGSVALASVGPKSPPPCAPPCPAAKDAPNVATAPAGQANGTTPETAVAGSPATPGSGPAEVQCTFTTGGAGGGTGGGVVSSGSAGGATGSGVVPPATPSR